VHIIMPFCPARFTVILTCFIVSSLSKINDGISLIMLLIKKSNNSCVANYSKHVFIRLLTIHIRVIKVV